MAAAAEGTLCNVVAAVSLSAIMAARISAGFAEGPFAIIAANVSLSATRHFVQAA